MHATDRMTRGDLLRAGAAFVAGWLLGGLLHREPPGDGAPPRAPRTGPDDGPRIEPPRDSVKRHG